MIRAVLFDMGGTVLDFVRHGARSWREWESRGIQGLYRHLLAQGHRLPAEEAFVAVMFERLAEGWNGARQGTANLQAIDWLTAGVAEYGITLDEAAVANALMAYIQPLRDGVHAIDGAASALAELRTSGMSIGLISNTFWPAAVHLEDLSNLKLLPYFDHTLFSGDAGIWKPRPEIFDSMLKRLDVTADEAIFIGDNPHDDIAGAQQAGMRACWIRNTIFTAADIQPDAIIERYADLPDLISHW
ncbi:MAG TPA: HAD family hydrolase [Roseiflexaceae bacterium]|nr:HAD family hydrolase [Roseiflexaceae bacterium]HMP40641.1 HAD family hydrolase [Roseiflexaceae bacterium]